MLEPDPAKRYTSDMVLAHRWFKPVRLSGRGTLSTDPQRAALYSKDISTSSSCSARRPPQYVYRRHSVGGTELASKDEAHAKPQDSPARRVSQPLPYTGTHAHGTTGSLPRAAGTAASLLTEYGGSSERGGAQWSAHNAADPANRGIRLSTGVPAIQSASVRSGVMTSAGQTDCGSVATAADSMPPGAFAVRNFPSWSRASGSVMQTYSRASRPSSVMISPGASGVPGSDSFGRPGQGGVGESIQVLVQ